MFTGCQMIVHNEGSAKEGVTNVINMGLGKMKIDILLACSTYHDKQLTGNHSKNLYSIYCSYSRIANKCHYRENKSFL